MRYRPLRSQRWARPMAPGAPPPPGRRRSSSPGICSNLWDDPPTGRAGWSPKTTCCPAPGRAPGSCLCSVGIRRTAPPPQRAPGPRRDGSSLRRGSACGPRPHLAARYRCDIPAGGRPLSATDALYWVDRVDLRWRTLDAMNRLPGWIMECRRGQAGGHADTGGGPPAPSANRRPWPGRYPDSCIRTGFGGFSRWRRPNNRPKVVNPTPLNHAFAMPNNVGSHRCASWADCLGLGHLSRTPKGRSDVRFSGNTTLAAPLSREAALAQAALSGAA